MLKRTRIRMVTVNRIDPDACIVAYSGVRLASIPCPDLGDPPVVGGQRLGSRRVALISTAGLMHQGDRPFSLGSADYRILDMEDSRAGFSARR
jgi:hypothetical protein